MVKKATANIEAEPSIIISEDSDRFKQLAKSYFIKQKTIEVLLVIVALFLSAIILPLIGYGMSLLIPPLFCAVNDISYPIIMEECENLISSASYGNYLTSGIHTVIVLFFMYVTVFIIVALFRKWIRSNWERARNRARSDLTIAAPTVSDAPTNKSYY